MTLTIDHLQIGYSGFCLVSPISLTLKAGEALTITGNNGIGKSTCLATIAGLLPPLDGGIHNQFPSLHFLPVSIPIHFALTVRENLLYWAALVKGDDQKGTQALTYFQLDMLEHDPCAHLSAGQRQRLHLCRLFLKKASLWILDEPYRSLDPIGRGLLNALIEDHLQAGGAVLMAQTMSPLVGRELSLSRILRAA